MSVVLWIVQVLLGLAFLGAGILKVTKSRQELEPAMPWVEDVGDGTLRLIGVLEMLAATGLLVPSVRCESRARAGRTASTGRWTNLWRIGPTPGENRGSAWGRRAGTSSIRRKFA
jgi:hypothetical protein